MAGNLMKRAAAYRKNHPSLSMQEAVKKVAAADRAGKKPARKKAATKKPAAKKKPVARKKAAPKKKVARKAVGSTRKKAPAAAPARRKVKVKAKGKRTVVTISGISMNKVQQELSHQGSLNTALARHKALLKEKGLKPAEKQAIKRDIAHYNNLIKSSKAHVTALKRSI